MGAIPSQSQCDNSQTVTRLRWSTGASSSGSAPIFQQIKLKKVSHGQERVLTADKPCEGPDPSSDDRMIFRFVSFQSDRRNNADRDEAIFCLRRRTDETGRGYHTTNDNGQSVPMDREAVRCEF
jgi:hypothetical protein